MNTVKWQDYITVDPNICHGKACIKGTRVMVTVILDNLAAGFDADQIVESYPTVSREAVQATLGYAAELAKDRVATLGRQSGRRSDPPRGLEALTVERSTWLTRRRTS